MLNPAEAQELRVLTQHLAWKNVLCKRWEQQRQVMMQLLATPPQKRTGEFEGATDDFVRGMLAAISWNLTAWHQELVSDEINRRQEEIQRHNGSTEPATNLIG